MTTLSEQSRLTTENDLFPSLTMVERVKHFKHVFPQYLAPSIHNDALYVCWIIGSLMGHRTVYYGEYPYKVKERILALFPDAKRICHIFSGIVKDSNTITYDIKADLNPTIVDSVMNIEAHREQLEDTDLFMADPPYDASDFEKYGVPPFDKTEAIRRIGKVAKRHAFLAWLDIRSPMYSKKTWTLRGQLAMVVGCMTRYRCFTLLEKT